jgi:hypothetical protein
MLSYFILLTKFGRPSYFISLTNFQKVNMVRPKSAKTLEDIREEARFPKGKPGGNERGTLLMLPYHKSTREGLVASDGVKRTRLAPKVMQVECFPWRIPVRYEEITDKRHGITSKIALYSGDPGVVLRTKAARRPAAKRSPLPVRRVPRKVARGTVALREIRKIPGLCNQDAKRA